MAKPARTEKPHENESSASDLSKAEKGTGEMCENARPRRARLTSCMRTRDYDDWDGLDCRGDEWAAELGGLGGELVTGLGR